MKNICLLMFLIFAALRGAAQAAANQQDTLEDPAKLQQHFLKTFSDNACNCIDSISLANKSSTDVSKDVATCIDSQVGAYQMASKLADVLPDIRDKSKKNKKTPKNIDVNLNYNPQSAEYQKYYRRLERYLMDSCSSLRTAIGQNNIESKNSISSNFAAQTAYSMGVDYLKKDDFKNAVVYFEKAVSYADTFAFAWDNIGICYRHLGEYDKALSAYQKSLSLVPNGIAPLQNIPVVYEFQKKYDAAIAAYKNLEKIYPDNPEGYYGAGRVLLITGNDTAALREMCRAYVLYDNQRSPYRTDAETMIQTIYSKMKGENRLDEFNEILKEFNISQAKE